MSVGNVFGVVSLALFAIYLLGSHLPVNTLTANLRGFSLLLILPLSAVAGWKGSRVWWVLSAVMVVLAVVYIVALSEHR